MPNVIAMIAYNNLDLTKQAVASALAQDIGDIRMIVIDNGSTDGTPEWLASMSDRLEWRREERNISPLVIGNRLMAGLFGSGCQEILGIPNDVILPPNLYRLMSPWRRGIVAATQTSEKDFPTLTQATAVAEHTPMAVVLVRKWLHDAIVSRYGYFFDDGMFHYASDCDLALRMAACGIRGIQLSVQYWHYCSATLKNATGWDRDHVLHQADEDRAYFARKWGFAVESPEYGQRAGDINFRG